MLDYLNQLKIPYAIIVTKTDKLNKTELTAALEAIASDPLVLETEAIFGEKAEIIPFSALKLTGLDDVKRVILGAVK